MKNTLYIISFLCLTFFICAHPLYAQDAQLPPRFIVKYKPGQSPTTLQQEAAKRQSMSTIGRTIQDIGIQAQGDKTPEQKLQEIRSAQEKTHVIESKQLITDPKIQSSSLKDIQIIKTADTVSVEEVRKTYQALPEVEYVEPDLVHSIRVVPNDTYYPSMWNLTKIQASQAWDITTGSNQVTVAVVDTGTNYNHSDLPTNIIKGHDYVNNDDDPLDDNGHGTHIAGTIGALTNNSRGISGINWQVQLMAVKVLGAGGGGYSSGIAQGVIYAVDNGAKVINFSLGGPGRCPQIYQDAFAYAYQHGVTIFGATGEGQTPENMDQHPDTPTSCNNLIRVSATGPTDQRASYAFYGSTIDIAAPGGDSSLCTSTNRAACSITSTYLNNQYYYMEGTSMATPHAAGVAALLLAINPNLSPDDIARILKDSADPISTDYPISGKRLNAFRAVQMVSQNPTLTPSAQPTNSPPPTAEPTNSPSPTVTETQPQPTTYEKADADHSGCVGIIDFSIWFNAMVYGTVQAGTYPNMYDEDNEVNILDFQIWYNSMKNLPANKICQ